MDRALWDDLLACRDKTDAIAHQQRLQYRCLWTRVMSTGSIRLVAGIDVAYDGGCSIAAMAVLSLPDLRIVDCVTVRTMTAFPYIPGLFAFREGPAALKVWQHRTTEPDLVLFHGHGSAHPHRFGLACHLGVIIDRPSIGVAERNLLPDPAEHGSQRGSTAPVVLDGEIVGAAVRTVAGARSVYVSPGHLTDCDQAVEVVLLATRGHRLPEPIREAHAAAVRSMMQGRVSNDQGRINRRD
jgi:deoxyribonuclease V